MPFAYEKHVQFYDTDCMGVVHHANYLRYFEEARVAWLRAVGLLEVHAPFSDLSFAVLSSGCEHVSACRFGDILKIRLQVRREGAKIRFQYAVYTAQDSRLIATGHTLHVALDGQFRVGRLPESVKKQLEKETWTETWP